MDTPIHNFLTDYAGKRTVRCHMPGGKGENNPLDITEIDGADTLFEAEGIIYESERNAASLFGAGATLYSCGGSTLAIQGMLGTLKMLTRKKTIIAGRYCHKSLLTSCILLDYNIKWAYPDDYLSAAVSPDEIERLIDEDVAGVFVSSVDYYGGEADICAIADLCHRHGIYLLVDNAHGAYKVFTDDHPILLGADMTADSAHKTLPALTGAAYLHLKDELLYRTAKESMSLFGSSSPSYLIMDSLDLCNTFIDENNNKAKHIFRLIDELKKQLNDMGFALRKCDAMRIVIDACACGYKGYELAQVLREMGVECEMSDEDYVVLLFSVAQPEKDFERLADVMKHIPLKKSITHELINVLHPEYAMPPREAYHRKKEIISTKDASGRICGGIHCPCPPCVPLVMPGEKIDHECIGELLRYGVEEVAVVE